MALSATVYHFQIELSDVDRGVYESLDLRVARHPSESMPYLLTRVIAYALLFEEGIAFSKGLSTTDEPPVWVKDLQGNLRVWVELGTPSAERLHKVSKASPRVVVFTQHDPRLLIREAQSRPIHKAEQIEVYALEPAFLDRLGALTERNARWTLLRNDGLLYVTVGDETVSGAVTRHALVEAGAMSRRSSNEGLHSEPLRAALASALAGKPAALEDLLSRHGDGHGARPNLRLAAAFGAEISALPGNASRLLDRLGANDGAPDTPEVFLPIAAAHGWVGRLRADREVGAAWAALAMLAGDERAPVRLGTLDALASFAGRPGGGARCWRRRSTGWSSTIARSASAPPAWSSRCSPTARRWPRSADPETLLDYLSRAIAAVAGAPRAAERSDARRRLLLALPRTLAGVAAGLRAGDRGAAWLEEECRNARHPDLREALSKTILILADKSSGQGAVLAQTLRAALEGSAKPPRDPDPHPSRRRPRPIVAPDSLIARVHRSDLKLAGPRLVCWGARRFVADGSCQTYAFRIVSGHAGRLIMCLSLTTLSPFSHPFDHEPSCARRVGHLSCERPNRQMMRLQDDRPNLLKPSWLISHEAHHYVHRARQIIVAHPPVPFIQRRCLKPGISAEYVSPLYVDAHCPERARLPSQRRPPPPLERPSVPRDHDRRQPGEEGSLRSP